MGRKKLAQTFEPLNPWVTHSLEAVAAYLGHRDTEKLQRAVRASRAKEPVVTTDEKIERLAAAPWQPQGRSFSIAGVDFYRAIEIDPAEKNWLAHFEKPPEKTKESEVAALRKDWDDLVKKNYGRTNIKRMREVYARWKALEGRAPFSGIFKGELFNFIASMSNHDPRERFHCAILPNGYPVAIETALEVCDEDFEIIEMNFVAFCERLLVASRAEADKRDEADKRSECHDIYVGANHQVGPAKDRTI